MSIALEPCEADLDYLREELSVLGIKSTDNQEEWYCERVSVMVIDGKVEDTKARELVFKAYKKRCWDV